jgi:hypothetical protein
MEMKEGEEDEKSLEAYEAEIVFTEDHCFVNYEKEINLQKQINQWIQSKIGDFFLEKKEIVNVNDIKGNVDVTRLYPSTKKAVILHFVPHKVSEKIILLTIINYCSNSLLSIENLSTLPDCWLIKWKPMAVTVDEFLTIIDNEFLDGEMCSIENLDENKMLDIFDFYSFINLCMNLPNPFKNITMPKGNNNAIVKSLM